jgi:glycosyltransferase involved in cell wall biosynthesis
MPPMPAHKILHLITSLERGGAQTMLTQVATRLDRARFAPLVVSLIDGGACADELRAASVPVASLGMRRGLPSLGALARLKHIIRTERPALIASWLYHADLMALLAAGDVPFAWHIRLSSIEGERNRLRLRLLRRMLAAGSRRPELVLANSEAGRRAHAALGYRPRRWEVVPNGFDVERFRPDPARRARWRREFGIDDAHVLVGMVARVDGMKDHAAFLAAAQFVAPRRAGVRFLLVGAGTDNLPVPPELSGRLQALGERGDVHEILPALDILVLASKGEGFPNVVGEAMACGVPCIASDVGDAAALIGDTGRVVPPANAPALAAAILALVAEGEPARARRGGAARQRILEHYSIDAVVARHAAIYGAMADHAR